MMEWSMDWKQNKGKGREQAIWMSEFCRQKLLGYAESFRELSRSFGGTVIEEEFDRQRFLEEQRMNENRQVMGDSLNALAEIMACVAEEVAACHPMEEKKKRMLIHALRAEGIYMENLYYLPEDGEKCAIGMTLCTQQKGGRRVEEVADMLSVLLRRQIRPSVTSPCLVDRTVRWFIFVEEAAYIALTGFARAVKEDETVSGDHYAVVESEKGKMSLLLSDGTGSGEKASEGSGRVLDLMEKMMEAGYDTKAAISMVNAAFFAMGEDSNHPTLDICELDLYQGNCDICKVGGAATFLKRGEQVEQIAMGSLPLGIFQTVDMEWEHRELQHGDYLIMMTDGVLDVFGGQQHEDAMLDAISRLQEQNPGEIAERLLELTLCLSEGHIRDDMTILVAGVWENSR